MPNIKSIIQKHNKRIMNMHKNNPVSNIKSNEINLCNCHNSNECSLDKRYQIKNFIYKATFISDKETKYCIGSAGNTFENRCKWSQQ